MKQYCCRGGFTFLEVLFSVMILGIGLIMVAGIFPAAIGQLQSAGDDSVGAAIGRGACAQLSGLLDSTNAPSTDGAVIAISTTGVLGPGVDGNLCDADPRYSWIAAYRRAAGSNVAQVYVVVARSRSRSAYSQRDLLASGQYDHPPVVAWRTFKGRLEYAGGPGILHVAAGEDELAPGATIITASSGALGETGGQIYRVGNQRDTATDWDLEPGNGMTRPDDEPDGAIGFLVLGRGYTDPDRPEAGYSGAAQEVAIYTTFVWLK